jgi:deoxyribose-phosphate aldolase
MSESEGIARRILASIDLTSLNDDHDDDIATLCAKALTRHGPVAAVCSWPEHTADMADLLREAAPRVAAVINFPEGSADREHAVREAHQAIGDGADELDLVWPYGRWLDGDRETAASLVASVKHACNGKTLKVILETGALGDPATVAAASRAAIGAGADMLKTSTGKISIGATQEAAEAMLHAIRESKRDIGFKASGGIRTLDIAASYLNLAEHVMGKGWATPKRFRIGASGLLDGVLRAIDEAQGTGGREA